jgi:hypothetical protein
VSGDRAGLASVVYGGRPVNRQRRTRAELAAVDDAIAAAVELEHPITLRGVFYRAVAAGAIDKTEDGYRLAGRELLKLRRAGAVPYDWITDGTRWINKPDSYDDLGQMLEDAAASYRRALWRDQPAEVQLYSEKDAISGVVLPVTRRWDVPLGIVRGYSSETFAWSVAQSILAAAGRGKTTYVYQLGDHDPSGVDAWRAFRSRVVSFLGMPVTPEMAAITRQLGVPDGLFAAGEILGVTEVDADGCEDLPDAAGWMFIRDSQPHRVVFARLAVTEDQIGELGLPARPTKQADSRAPSFAGGSVEVDAIPPTVLRQIVEDAITDHIDPAALRLTEAAEQSEREILTRMTGRRNS